MCLIAFAYHAHPRYPLVLAANRDEFTDRPAEPARFWPDAPNILAGRDLRAGGTWLGITRDARFAAITNYRDLHRPPTGGPSRGQLVRNALDRAIDTRNTADYEGFNLLYGPLHALRYHNNIEPTDAPVSPGIHALSNHFLDTPWPKVQRAKTQLAHVLSTPEADWTDGLFALLADDSAAPDAQLPATGLPVAMERAVSSIFIRTAGYGTRCSTVILVGVDGTVQFEERTHPAGTRMQETFATGLRS